MEAFCHYPYHRIKIQSDGTCGNCCFMSRGVLGNIIDDGYEEVWNSVLAQKVREEVSENILPVVCQTDSCPYQHMTASERVWQIEPVAENEGFPTEIELDLPDSHCNVGGTTPTKKYPACLMCERHLQGVVQEDRVDEVCETIAPYIKYIRAFHVQGIAEAFWKDRIFDIFKKTNMKEYKNQVYISTTTNATILDQKRREQYLEYPNSNLTFSLDAARPETFKLIRRWDMFEKVCENIKNYTSERNSPTQMCCIHNNINMLNIAETVEMVDLAQELGVDWVDFNPTYGIRGLCVDGNNAHLFEEAQGRINERAHEIGMKVTFMRDLALCYSAPKDPPLVEISLDRVQELSKELYIQPRDIIQMAKKHPDQVEVSQPKYL